MKEIESGCVNCGLPCMGTSCPNYRVVYLYCDKCGDSTDLYHYDGQELCLSCIVEEIEKDLEKVEV